MKSFILGLIFVFLLSGCAKDNKIDIGVIIQDNKPIIEATVKVAASKGTVAGLKKWAEKSPDSAKETATLLSNDITLNILPYLEGKADFKTQDEIDSFLTSSVADKFPDESKQLISDAFLVLDSFVKTPDAGKLNPDALAFLKDFLSGVKSGCDNFLK